MSVDAEGPSREQILVSLLLLTLGHWRRATLIDLLFDGLFVAAFAGIAIVGLLAASATSPFFVVGGWLGAIVSGLRLWNDAITRGRVDDLVDEVEGYVSTIAE